MKDSLFTEAYYMRGPQAGLSNYENYRWLGPPTLASCVSMAKHLGIRYGDSIIDWGCALGMYVKAFRDLGHEAFGYDTSDFAIKNAHEDAKPFVSDASPASQFDWVILKDTAEHIPYGELTRIVPTLATFIAKKGMFFVVPICEKQGGRYVRKEDEADSTHMIRWTLNEWILFLEDHAPNFNVSGSYHIHGVKPASATVVHSCGFLTLNRQ